MKEPSLPCHLARSIPGESRLARRGQGIVAGFGNWLQPHFDAGRLMPVLPEWWQGCDGPRLCFPSRAVAPALRAFIDMVAEDRAGG